MTPPPIRHVPDRTHRAADRLLPVLGAVFAAALCVFLIVPAELYLPRVPAFFGGWLAGLLLPRLYRHRWRAVGIAPWAATAGAVVLLAVGGPPDDRPAWLVGLFCLCEGAACGAILRFRDKVRPEYPHFLLSAGLGVLVTVGLVAAFNAVGHAGDDWREAYRWLLAGAAVGLALLSWLTLARMGIEWPLGAPLRVLYRVRTAGPGWAAFPSDGPVLVVANHAAWVDPLVMAQFIPRPITPMMTGRYYDLPALRWLLRRVFRVIRVAEHGLRREAPEVQEAVAALDAGKCVVIYPEGYMRRKEEQLLRRFGQGVWQILRARPATPVVACWIEGTWGSYFSYFNGPPRKNKRMDIRRRIGLGLSAPEAVPADVLADGLPTRVYLMNRVLDARKPLGLPDVPRVELPGGEGEPQASARG